MKKPQEIDTQPSFGSAKPQKFIEKVRTAESFKHFNATFYDMVSAYNELGFNVFFKRGSHAIIQISDTINVPLVIPHKSKYVHPKDLKRLKLIINGEIDKALKIN